MPARFVTWLREFAIVAALTTRTGTFPLWRLSPSPPPAYVIVVGEPVAAIDR